MKIVELLLGKPLASDEEEHHKAGVLGGIPMLGLDALASSAYGPEAALTILLPLGLVGLQYIGPIVIVILILLAILYFSYRQTIAAYPNGGGSYTVAKENLGFEFGLLAASALMLDYVLNVAVGISAGIGALVSALPVLHGYTLSLCLGALALITLVNLRGIRESGLYFSIPAYLFIVALGGTLALGVFRVVTAGGHPHPVVPPSALPAATAGLSLWMLLRAFASGCTAMTGVEAVSNGVTAFAKPSDRRAQQTLTAIVAILALLLMGIAYLSHAYRIGAMLQDRPGYQSVISQLAGAILGRGPLYYITLGSVLAVLSLSANTSFAGFPRLCRLVAEDDYLPHLFANKGRRLVYSTGICILAIVAGALLTVFGGITDRLIPLFAVGAFLAFTLSQAGMVLHWKREGGKRSTLNLAVNLIGCLSTAAALIVIVIAKFTEGAWITLLLIPSLLLLFSRVKRHYEHVRQEITCPRAIDVAGLKPPLLVVPITGWNTVAEKGLRYAIGTSNEVIAVHISADEEQARELREQWARFVEQPIRGAGLPPPRLEVLSSPYRQLFEPLIRYVERLKEQHPDRVIAILIPELVEPRWYHYLLHNQAATVLKAMLLVRGGKRVVVINVPWYLREEAADKHATEAMAQKRVAAR